MELTANFVTSVTIGNAPLDVAFTNTSSGPYIRVEWDFGDGAKSTQINPTHVYTVDGSYNVVLTIYADDGSSKVTARTITVLKEQAEVSNDSDTQQTLLVAKRFTPGQVSVRKSTTTGTTFETNLPLTAATDGTLSLNLDEGYAVSASSLYSNFQGTNLLIYNKENETNIEQFLLAASGDALVAVVLNPSGSTTRYDWEDMFPGTGQTQVLPKAPVLFYTITNFFSGSDLLTLHRETPFGADNSDASSCTTYFWGSSGSNVIQGSSMNAPYTVPKIKWGIDAADEFITKGAVTDFVPSVKGLGTYFGQTGETGLPYALLYFDQSGATVSNRWYPGNTTLNIPWVMWHEYSNAAGVIGYDSADPTQLDAESGLKYRYLRAGTTQQDTIIGKVFHDKQMILITDPELSIVLHQYSDRSWTLPEPSFKFIPDTSGWLSGGTDSPTGCSWYFTYSFSEFGYSHLHTGWRTRPTTTGDDPGFGYSLWGFDTKYTNTVPSGYIQRIDVPSGNSGVGHFTFTIPKLNHATGGTLQNQVPFGFTPNWLTVYMATGATGSAGPDMNSWKAMTGLSSHDSNSIWSSTTKQQAPQTISVDNSSEYRPDLSGTSWAWSGCNIAWLNANFSAGTTMGQQTLVAAFINGNFASDIYKMSAVCVGRNNEFNNTQNQTYDSSVNDSVFITEVGLYNESNDLLMVGKLSQPIEKNEQKFITVKLELDL